MVEQGQAIRGRLRKSIGWFQQPRFPGHQPHLQYQRRDQPGGPGETFVPQNLDSRFVDLDLPVIEQRHVIGQRKGAHANVVPGTSETVETLFATSHYRCSRRSRDRQQSRRRR